MERVLHRSHDLAGTVDRLRRAGLHLRSGLITGVGGEQVVIDDPSGKPVELFEPTRSEARLTRKLHPDRTPGGVPAGREAP